jgi:hypothetical protein
LARQNPRRHRRIQGKLLSLGHHIAGRDDPLDPRPRPISASASMGAAGEDEVSR